ncbi:uncharacterized protein [Periplaneta americana]|uniref:uncharacterized protein isoform X6 n=1 Tax=Periplaneta americana TaxID=6978 RepID=UPI0037E8425B
MRKREWCADSNGNLPHLYIPRRYVENAMMSLSLVKNSGRKLSSQSDVRVGDTGEGHVMTQDTEEKKRRSTTATRDEKTPVLPARHDTTGKLMMLDAATQTSSSDHFEESSRRYAEWEEEVRLEELQHLQRVAIRLFDFSMYSEFHTDMAQRHTSQGPHHVLGRVRCTEQGCSELIPLSWHAGKSAVAIQSDRSTGGPPKLLALSTGLCGLYSSDDA